MVSIGTQLLPAFVLSLPCVLVASPAAAPDNTVSVSSPHEYCMIMPKSPHTNIGNSEHPGGMKSYCSASARTSNTQGLLPNNFWKDVEFKSGRGTRGKKWVQLTGCIRPETVDRLNPHDAGGQYDSSGGAGGRGNPRGSVCTGYNHYVELVEPRGPRACIKCCDDFKDCPVNKDTSGCPAVIPGNYFKCG